MNSGAIYLNGKYYKNNDIYYVFKCTNCNKDIELELCELNEDDMPDGWHFCPNCGSDNRPREKRNCDNCFLSTGEQCDILVPSENCKYWKPFPQ